MKKIILILTIILLIPYLIVTLFIKEDISKIKFIFTDEQKVRVKQTDNGNIIEIPLEEYIMGVIAGEMPLSFEEEALKAQAVAARSYVLKKISQNYKNEYDVVDTVLNQVYLDDETLKNKWQDTYYEKIEKIKRIVLDTKGEYLTYNGEVIEAFFFSTSTGYTENCEEVFIEALPYLRSVESHYDEISPVYETQSIFSLNEFYQKLNLKYSDLININILKTTSTGRIKKIKINDKEFTGSEVASKLQIRSNFFEIKQNGNQVIVNTKGYGHGVGMSQYGANGMAKEGYNYEQILKHYYTGVEISKI